MLSPDFPPRTLVSLATYNESANLAPLIAEIHAGLPTADVLVIDDNSPDGTGRLADSLAAADSRIQVLHRPGKLGLGTAILAAMRHALDHGFEFCVTMDADFSHHPRYLPALLAGMKRNDVMIGSRYVPGGATVNWPLSRWLISRCVNTLVRLLMRIPANDTSGGYRCYRLAKLPRASLACLLSHGYSFEEEVLYRCHKAGCRIGETPIVFEARRAGASKVNVREAVRSLLILLRVGLREVFGGLSVLKDAEGSKDGRANGRSVCHPAWGCDGNPGAIGFGPVAWQATGGARLDGNVGRAPRGLLE